MLVIPPKEPLQHTVCIRVSSPELEWLKKLAKSNKTSISRVIRAMIVNTKKEEEEEQCQC